MNKMTLPDYLYHWSPRSRRKGIQRYGLVPGKPSVSGDWKPPFVCLGSNPYTAWFLSGELHPEIEEWDLWQVGLEEGHHVELLPFDDGTVKEVRVYDRVFKRGVWLVGERNA